jgi:hypothetical protein
MEISRHISELLFDHDCVIVPTLGGFLASNQPASVQKPNLIIYPPYRKIAFNVYLRQNDGLLANHIVTSENILYSEAVKLIESFVLSCFETLDDGKKVSISEVGTLFFDKEKNIQFESFRNSNHLRDSFGMQPVQLIPVSRDNEIEKNVRIKPAIRPSIKIREPKPSRQYVKKGGRIIGVIAVGAAIVWFSLNLYLVAPKKYEATSLNPFDSQLVMNHNDSVRNSPPPAEIKSTDTTAAQQNTDAIQKDSTPEVALNQPAENTPPPVEEKKTVVPQVTNKQPEITTISNETGKNYVVAGVFKIRENALTLAAQLQQNGYPEASVIDANHMTYVAFRSFSSGEDAVKLAESLHEKNLDGWVWKH